MPFEIMISVEALRTLIALERPVVGWTWLSMSLVRRMASIHMVHARNLSAVEARQNSRLHAAHK